MVSGSPTMMGHATAKSRSRATNARNGTDRSAADPKLILVVDDDEDIREVLSEVLEDSGYHVVRAANGKEALALLRREVRPHVILLDLMMPVMDGWQLRSELLNDPSLASIPVIVISAGSGQVPPSGTAAYLSKPLDLRRLLTTVKQCCA